MLFMCVITVLPKWRPFSMWWTHTLRRQINRFHFVTGTYQPLFFNNQDSIKWVFPRVGPMHRVMARWGLSVI